MKKIIKISFFGFAFFAIIALVSYIIFPNQTKAVSTKTINSTKKIILNLRDKHQKAKFSTYQPTADEIWGIDISHHQKEINWNEIGNNKPYFVFLKSTEGTTHIDTKHKAYKKKFNDLSIPSGSYHFFSYSTNGTAQAKHFLKNTKIKNGDLMPVLDVEFKNKMPNKSEVITNINEFIEHINEQVGTSPIIYCECDFYYKYLKDNLMSECSYWISDFWREPKCDYILWQKTDKFQHKAFKGTVDFNILKGTKNDLNNLLIK
jgi:lysozyme